MATRLSDADLTALLVQNSGWRGDELAQAFAIARRESGGRPDAHNGNAATGDNSYGLFQINLLGGLIARLKAWGLNKPEDLYDPATNVRAAYRLWQGSGWKPWGGYKKEWNFDPFTNTNLSGARAAVAANISGAETRKVSTTGGTTDYPAPTARPGENLVVGNPPSVIDTAGGLLGSLNPFAPVNSAVDFLRTLPQQATKLAVLGVVAAGGVAIIVLGAWRAVAPARQAIENRVAPLASVAAVA